MSERPPDVRIEDIRRPVLPQEVLDMAPMVDEMAGALDWSVDGLTAAAIEATGLSDFGEDIFSEPIGALTSMVPDEARLSGMGKMSLHGYLTNAMTQRLLVEDLYARHPEINDVQLEPPIVIIGLPRTGTTHLHNLISSDPALRSLKYFESVEPVPPLVEQFDGMGSGDVSAEPRWQRVQERCDQLDTMSPYFKRMHEMSADYVHEEIDLLMVSGSSMSLETMVPMRSWVDYYLGTDQTPFYAYTERILRALAWMNGPNRWVLKSPQHLEQIQPLLNVYPDASFVVTYRDPVSITLSLNTMIAYTARFSMGPYDVEWLGHYWAERIEKMLGGCMADRHLLPDDQVLDCLFHEFMADDVAMVARIYEMAGQPFDDGVRGHMEAFMADNPRGKHGRVLYDINDFGLDRAERRAAFVPYMERFGVEQEGD